MPRHSETRFLPYSPDQLFNLVADVANYDKFLPWVVAVRVRSSSEAETIADLVETDRRLLAVGDDGALKKAALLGEHFEDLGLGKGLQLLFLRLGHCPLSIPCEMIFPIVAYERHEAEREWLTKVDDSSIERAQAGFLRQHNLARTIATQNNRYSIGLNYFGAKLG